jgi:hypothetical protein
MRYLTERPIRNAGRYAMSSMSFQPVLGAIHS